ncbi:aldo/keto reductase [Nonomuraea sp. NPDC049400]|uniref:aldo/keto reductase n=1 Tax=Nonomuraea sp. NPDC049400 TaxID=3364352 RepID=UPI00378A6481
MEYISFGRTGMRVSRLSLGCLAFGSSEWRPWVLNAAECTQLIQAAYEAGINFFDTADAYSAGQSETVLGSALNDMKVRDSVVIATKIGLPMGDRPHERGLSRKRILRGVDDALRRLDTDYIDLLQLHRLDPGTPIEVVLEALDDVVRSGKVLYVGASSMFAWEMCRALYIADREGWTRFANMQAQLNLIYREEEREMLPLCAAEQIAVTVWSPLARGFLAGNRRRGDDGTLRAQTDGLAQKMYYHDNDFDVVDRLCEVARDIGAQPAQVALAWVIRHPANVVPVIGVSNMRQLSEAVEAMDIALSDTDRVRLEEAYRPHPVEWGV